MEQKKPDNKKDWIAIIKKYKYLIIISAVFLVILFVAPIALLNPTKHVKVETKNNQQVLPLNNAGETTVAFGVEMKNECFNKFQDFIKTYGADYTKCLADFNFNQDYCGGFNPDTQGLSNVNVIVILDASGSMADKIGADAKIDIAKKAISDFLIKMPKGVRTGLVVYGDKGSNSLADKDLSCKGIEEIVKLGANNSSNIIAAMDSFSPKGWTPIAGSFDFVKNIFKNAGAGDKNYLVLVSDGIESCGGDPLNSAEDLKLAIPGIKLNIVGFTNDFDTEKFLARVAALGGGGSYFTAFDASAIAKVFNDQLLAIKKECITETDIMLFSLNNINNMNNLNCWLASEKKELTDFSLNILQKSVDTECNSQMSQALQARQNEFWAEKAALIEKNDAIYKKIDADFINQLKVLDSTTN